MFRLNQLRDTMHKISNKLAVIVPMPHTDNEHGDERPKPDRHDASHQRCGSARNLSRIGQPVKTCLQITGMCKQWAHFLHI